MGVLVRQLLNGLSASRHGRLGDGLNADGGGSLAVPPPPPGISLRIVCGNTGRQTEWRPRAEAEMLSLLVEDQQQSEAEGAGYVDYLCAVHRQVQSRLMALKS